MVDSNIKKITILKKDLPNYIGDNDSLSYQIRYRVVSEDKNRTSHWSPIYKVGETSTFEEVGFNIENIAGTSIPHNVIINDVAHLAGISWTMPALLITNPTNEEKILQEKQASIKNFDIYVQWKTGGTYGNWTWVGVSQGTQYSMTYPSTGPTHMKFRVQKITQVKQAFDAATYLISSEQTL
jgi:hypothetical protein